MSFTPRFAYTDGIVRDLLTIERARAVVEVLPVTPDRALAMRQAARQRATASSTAIEGNNGCSLRHGTSLWFIPLPRFSASVSWRIGQPISQPKTTIRPVFVRKRPK
jgi:hypothetical protein